MLTRSWDIDRLKQVFWPMDVHAILSLSLSWSIAKNWLIWHYDRRGVYSIKTGYQCGLNSKLIQECSVSEQNTWWWKRLWNLNIPPKVKVFLWRVFYNALLTASNLAKRRVLVDTICHRCIGGMKDLVHALFTCKKSLAIWKAAGLWDMLKPVSNGPSHSLLPHLLFFMSKQTFE